MKCIHIIFTFLLIFLIPPLLGDDVLKLAIEVCRDGQRAPTKAFPNEDFGDKFSQGLEVLTPRGMTQHYELGQQLRSKLIDEWKFLSPNYTASEIYVQSSTADRCLMSAQMQMFGLYPPESSPSTMQGEQQQTDLPFRFQPVPIHSYQSDYDPIISGFQNCPKYSQILEKQVYTSQVWKEKEDESAELTKIVSEILGQEINFSDLWEVAEHLDCESERDRLSGFTSDIVDQIQDARSFIVEQSFLPLQEVKKLVAGPLIHEILSKLNKAVRQESPLKFALYSGHEETLISLLTALDTFDGQVPPFASTFFIYLWSTNSDPLSIDPFDYYVTFAYNHEPLKLSACGGADKCRLDLFLRSLREISMSPSQWFSTCHGSLLSPSFGLGPDDGDGDAQVVLNPTLVGAIVLVVFLAGFALLFRHTKKVLTKRALLSEIKQDEQAYPSPLRMGLDEKTEGVFRGEENDSASETRNS